MECDETGRQVMHSGVNITYGDVFLNRKQFT